MFTRYSVLVEVRPLGALGVFVPKWVSLFATSEQDAKDNVFAHLQRNQLEGRVVLDAKPVQDAT